MNGRVTVAPNLRVDVDTSISIVVEFKPNPNATVAYIEATESVYVDEGYEDYIVTIGDQTQHFLKSEIKSIEVRKYTTWTMPPQ